MRRAALAVLCVAACTELTGDFGDVVAIELLSPPSVTLEEQEEVVLEARALDLQGNPIDGVSIGWELIRRDTAAVGIALDSATGRVTALAPGQWDVRARVEELPTGPVTIRVSPAPDSIGVVGDSAVTVPPTSTQSPGLQVTLFDLTTTPGMPASLTGKPVTYRVTFPIFLPGDGSVVLVNGTVAEDSLSAVVNTSGQAASMLVRRKTGTMQPDSIIVEALALTAVGDTVPGSPVRFVVHFPIN